MKEQTPTIEFIRTMAERNAKRDAANPWKARLAEHLAAFIEAIEPTVADKLTDAEFIEALASVNQARDAEPAECDSRPTKHRDSHAHATRAPESPPNASQQNTTEASGEAVATQHAAAQAAGFTPGGTLGLTID